MKTTWENFGLSDNFSWAQHLIWSVIAIIMTWFTVRVVAFILGRIFVLGKRFKKNSPHHKMNTLHKVLRSLLNYLLWPACILIIISIWGVKIEAVLGGAGVMGLVLGFGLKDMMSDIIAGVFIIIEDHFNLGEVIEIDGFKGEVVEMGIKTTKIKSWDGKIKIVSNRVFKELINWSLSNTIITVEIMVDKSEDFKKVEKLINQTLKEKGDSVENLVEIPQVEGIDDVNSTSKKVIFFAECKPNTLYGVARKLRTYIYNDLEKNGIKLPRNAIHHTQN